MMRFDTIVSFHVRHDVICFKLGKCLDGKSDRVIPWTALSSSQSKMKNLSNVTALVRVEKISKTGPPKNKQ